MGDALAEILRSPLDDLPRRRRPSARGGLIIAVAAGLAAGTTLGWSVRATEDAAEPAATTTTAATVTAEGLPAGYVATGLGYGVRAEWITRRGDTLWVGISTAVSTDTVVATATPPGVGALGDRRRGIGRWTLTTASGQTITATREHFDDAAPGIVTLDFAATGVAPEDVAGLTVTPASGSGEHRDAATVATETLPLERTDLTVVATELVTQDGGTTTVGDAVTVVVDRLVVDRRSGEVAWHVVGGDDLGVMVEVDITIEGDTPEPDRLAGESGGSAAFLQRPFAPLTPARRGTVQLQRAAATTGVYAVTGLAIDWTISWFRYGTTIVDVPLDGIRALGDSET